MSKTQTPKTVTGRVLYTERHGHTVYGNPMISAHIVGPEVDGVSEHATYRLSDNASLVYAIENPEYKKAPHTFALTRAGRISHVVNTGRAPWAMAERGA